MQKINEMLIISDNAKYLFRNDQVIILNRTNRQWVKVSRECYDVLMQCNGKYTIKELLEMLADDEDREYINNVLMALDEMQLIGKSSIRKLHDVSFAISNRCNLKCKHCMVNADSCNENEYFTTEEIKQAFKKIIAAKPENITVTGGEPLVRTDFGEIITYLRENFDGMIGLMTNATLINRKNVDTIVSSVNNISISLDGANEETVSLIRGANVFKKVIESIELLHEKNFNNISVSMVVTADNDLYVEEFLELCKKYECKPMLRALSISGQAEKNKDLLTKRQLNIEKIDTHKIKKIEKPMEKSFYACSCDAGATTLTIESNGNIFPCNLFVETQYCLGNIKEVDDLQKLLQKNPKKFISDCLQEFEPDMIPECANCDISYFCWSCLHEVKELKDKGLLKQRCKYVKAELEDIWG
nr:radical SAM protein [uncultured Blautia sp.]